jgi:hypothetical protein
MTPATKDLTVYRGTTFGFKIVANDDDDDPVDLTGWSAFALVRETPQKHVVFDLEPAITDPTNGEVTVSLTDEQTLIMEPGVFVWDFVLERPTGERLGPFVAGTFTVLTAVARE